ncbi:MAG: RimK family alpha-L-glutamate ligase, partial [Clostridia bacterium]|nr:RimK family alpha-L-glutamate ligase [Clostridia bacterium]
DYCGIDVLYGENGGYLVCEVNSNAFFGGIERVTGVNVARLYAEYICSKIYN